MELLDVLWVSSVSCSFISTFFVADQGTVSQGLFSCCLDTLVSCYKFYAIDLRSWDSDLKSDKREVNGRSFVYMFHQTFPPYSTAPHRIISFLSCFVVRSCMCTRVFSLYSICRTDFNQNRGTDRDRDREGCT